MDLATMVLISITGFTPGYRSREVATFSYSDMAKCRAEIGIGRHVGALHSPMDRSRTYVLCLPVSERMIGRRGVKQWDNMKLWVTRDMLNQCACVPLTGGAVRGYTDVASTISGTGFDIPDRAS
jgi:hypothetical protein